MNDLPEFNFGDVVEDESIRLSLFEDVRDKGFSRVRGAPTSIEGLETLAGLFGHIQDSDALGTPYSTFVSDGFFSPYHNLSNLR